VGWLSGGGEFLVNVAYLALQFWLTVGVLQSLGLGMSSGSRFPAFFLVGLVTTLGILVGLVLLVIPGIFLFVRWSIASVAVIATDDRVSEAMHYSWQETERHFWPILIAFLVIYSAAAAGAVAGYMLEQQAPLYVGTILFEISINGGLIAGWHAAVAVYAETRRQSRYAEVFV
jgi:hypothetical protein